MNKTYIVFLTIATLIISTKTAHAYLDPGTGSYILQVLVGVITGMVMFAKPFWIKITSYFKIKKNKK